MQNTDMLKQLILENQFISFDIFDTLINRFVQERRQVFALVELAANENGFVINNFIEKRINAEKLAHKKTSLEEITLDEIYNILAIEYGANIASVVKKLEEDIEIGLTTVNTEIFNLFNFAKDNGKDIYIISDMYLSHRTIEKILKRNNIIGFKKLFVSSEYGVTKSTGNLFKFFLKTENINKENVLHIGDNLKSDVHNAKINGMNSYHYIKSVKYNQEKFSTKFLSNNEKAYFKCISTFINETIDNDKSRIWQIGYKVFGPFLFEYCKWIYNQCDNNVNKVFFLSRDGYVIHKAFAALYNQFNGCYFYTSRAATVIPSFYHDVTLDKVIDSYKSWPTDFNISFFLKKAGLKIEDIQDILDKFPHIMHKKFSIDSIKLDLFVNALFNEIKPIIELHASNQLKYLQAYYNQEKFYGNISIVDIGGSGTIEKALGVLKENQKIDITIFPLYILSNCDETKNRKSFLFSRNKNFNRSFYIRFFYMLIEVFFSAPHESVLGYKDGAYSRIEPIFEEVMIDDSNQYQYNLKFIETLHSGALAFIENIKNTAFNNFKGQDNIAFQALYNFGCMPTIEDVKTFSEYTFDCNGMKPIITRQDKQSILGLKEIMASFKNSLWPMGYLMLKFNSKYLNEFISYIYIMFKGDRNA